ncbi:MAG: tetratricopeptide repeat protein, partial [Alistipes sp.]|nr:tetratricopeptide repeat protein [Alistipes sp.]
MRRQIFLFSLLILSLSLPAAKAQTKVADDALKRAVSLCDYGHWIEARQELLRLRERLSSVEDREQIERVDYYLARCEDELQMEGAEARLRRFLAENGGSSFANDVQYELGDHYCMLGDDAMAEQELRKVDYNMLSPQQRDRYDLRMGYMTFMRGDYDESERYFSRIVPNSEYADHATYYKSYMAYARGELAEARRGFESLRESRIYADLMPFYVMQIDFKGGDYRAVVASGDALMQRTTPEQTLQINRMMAESWFQLQDYAAAVKYLRAYRSAGGEMGRVENYIMGYALYRQTLYAEALPHLREACGKDDLLTQNASYHLADCYLRANDKTNAMHSFAMASSAAFDKAIAEDALFNYGKLQYELGGGHFN